MHAEYPQNVHHGFLVVRLPEYSFDAEGRGAFSKKAPKLGDIYYGGVFRMPWFDLDEDYINGRLPPSLKSVRRKIRQANQDFTGIDVSDSYGDAENILKYSNQPVIRNEIIVVRSPKLQEIKGKILYTDLDIEWLGVDLLDLGHWSLLENGLFVSPSYFARWMGNLNKNGLLIEATDFEGFFQDFLVAVTKGGAEPLPPDAYGMEPIEIGRLRKTGKLSAL